MPVLDTNLLIRVSRQDPRGLDALRSMQGKELIVPAQAATEFLAGVEDPVASLASLHASYRIDHTSDAHVLEAARLRAEARRRGAGRPRWGDVQIAACAALHGTFVATSNKRDFQRLGVAAWDFTRDAPPGDRSPPVP